MFTNLCVFGNAALSPSPVGKIWTRKGPLTCVCQHMCLKMGGVQPRLRPRPTKFCLSGMVKNGQEWSKMFFP